MGKLLPFKRPSDGSEDIEAMLREFYAEEREMRECEWFDEAVERAMHSGSFDSNFQDLRALICWRGFELPATS